MSSSETLTVETGKARQTPPGRRPQRSISTWRSRGGLAALLIAAPGVILFCYFAWFPIGRALVMSFQETNFVSDPGWVGWSNFSYVLGDPLLWTALRNTAWYTVLAIIIGFPIPLFLAVFMAELRRRRGLYVVLAYIPTVIPPVAAILLWRTFLDPSPQGTFNALLDLVGLGPFEWLNSPQWAMPIIVVEVVWASFGSSVIIYIAALVGVRRELYEAAELDGAGIWKRVWHVTLPQIRGILLILVLLQIIGAMQVFNEPYIFTGGGPNNATITLLLLIYRYAFEQIDYGAATALSVLLALLLGVISVIYALATRRLSS